MATTIQLLRSDIARQRPDPGVLVNGVPMVNLNESEPGLFFSDRIGTLFKIGPIAVGDDSPNTSPEGEPGNSKGEAWLDTSGSSPVLKVYDGESWVVCFDDPGGTVTSVGLTFDSVFNVSDAPITTSGSISATLQDQVKNRVFASPDLSDGTPTFRALVANDIPSLNASKITTGALDPGRIPSLDASKITTGTFSPSLIPNLSASKITSGTLPYARGGTGVSSSPLDGELLIGNTAGDAWTKATLTAGANVSITNGGGSITISGSATPTFTSIILDDGAGETLTLGVQNIPPAASYTLRFPTADGTAGNVMVTDGSGDLSFVSSLSNITSISGLTDLYATGSLTIYAGGANNNITLSPTGSGSINVSLSKIVDLADPTADGDAANKRYVDGVAQGLDVKESVKVATTSDITLSGAQTVDGIAVSTGQRILVKNQLTQSENGIYIANTAGVWSRSADANVWDELVSAFVFVEEGASNSDNGYVCTVNSGGTLGVTAVTWDQFSGAGQITAGDGLSKTGNTLDVNVDSRAAGTKTTAIVSDEVRIDAGWTGQTSLTTLGTIVTGTWNANIIGLAYGGTGVDNTAITQNYALLGPNTGGPGNASFREILTSDVAPITGGSWDAGTF